MRASRVDLSSPIEIARRIVVFLAIATLLVSNFALSALALNGSGAKKTALSEDQRILHVLNRLGYGARPGEPKAGEPMSGEPMSASGANQATNQAADAESKKTAEYRQKIREYYEKNGLMQPQRIVGELQASRILRAVYSERQLQEVMVDF